MTEIRRIRPAEWTAAKQLVYRVLHSSFHEQRSLEEMIADSEGQGRLADMDDIQKNYFDQNGVFLVITEDDRVIGTGAIRRLEDHVCELKRLFLLEEYQGKGLGYRLLLELLQAAREFGYKKIRLETAPRYLKRATSLYRRVGFYEIPKYEATHPNDIAMEMIL